MNFAVIFLTCACIIGFTHGHPGTNEVDDVSSNSMSGGAKLMKNRVKGPTDIGIYYINSPGASCGGLKTALCSHDCGALGYPVYWCYPKVCYCHYGNSPDEENVALPS